ncbi:MAG: T9SS type A sorting domain-containing protein [Bacteroidia bacterium]|nr:T9SS type A sorting domain-containing protein [Bacteroidia bacterium]
MFYAFPARAQINVTSNTTWNSTPPTGYEDGITVKNNSTLTINGITLQMNKNKLINVEQGSKLIINGATLECSSFSDRWGGIRLQGDPNAEQFSTFPDETLNNTSTWSGVLNSNQTYIETNNSNFTNAIVGIESMEGAIVRARNTTFHNNGFGISIGFYLSPTVLDANASYVMDCTFDWTLDWPVNYNGYIGNIGIKLLLVKSINIGGCSFVSSPYYTNCTQGRPTGIWSGASNFSVGNSGNSLCLDKYGCYQNCYDGIAGGGCVFENLEYGIYHTYIINGINIEESNLAVRNSIFNNNFRSIFMAENQYGAHPQSNIVIIDNTFSGSRVFLNSITDYLCQEIEILPPMLSTHIIDVYLFHCGFNVYGNTFSYDGNHISHIMVKDGSNVNLTRGHIWNNTFSNTNPTTVISDAVYGVIVYGKNDLLKISVNTFSNMGTDIKITTNATVENPMSDKNGNAAGNIFSDPFPPNRLRIDNTGNAVVTYKYYNYSTNPKEDPLTYSVNVVDDFINFPAADPSETKCTDFIPNNDWGLSAAQFAVDTQIKIYPNPAHQFIEISNANNTNINNIKIYNLLGGLIFEHSCNKSTISLDVRDYTESVYFMEIDLDNGQHL